MNAPICKSLWIRASAKLLKCKCNVNGGRENSLTRVAGVFDNFWGPSLTPPGIEVLDDRKLGPSDVLGRTHYPL